ncbi:monothiol glutaredoxin grx5 [Cladophialophora chaetospira]|uniref:Monothiol glutaredoxin-5, mitochondrial n=1 Tax=Cladophialophora chaetospira TaxID=386627 RepID=A0AA38X7C2_9EURO|nr:monothiol glutaredoxin grx5 [Cladophialophora chaetospira]
MKPKYKLLVDEATGRSSPTTKHHPSQIESRSPLGTSSSVEIGTLLPSLPPGIQEMIYQHDFFNLDLIRFWVFVYPRANRINLNLRSSSKSPDLDFEVPIYALIAELRRILSVLEPEPKSLKRFDCMAKYLFLSGKFYCKVIQKARIFQEYRDQATDFVLWYQPRSLTDRNFFVYNSLMVIESWKNGIVLEKKGVLLVASLKHRFPELQDWEVVRDIALRGALSALSPSATHTTLIPRISSSLLQTRLLSSEVRTAIDKAVASAPVVLFMKGTPETPQCGFSRTSIQILGMQGVDPAKFTAFNVLEDEELRSGIKEYSDWPTIPQLYVDKEFVGGCDILINMHKDGSLADLLSEKNVLVTEDSEDASGGDVEGQKADDARAETEQSTGGRSKDAKGESS